MVTNSAALAQRVEADRRRVGVSKLRLSMSTPITRSTLTRRLAGDGDFKVWELIWISQQLTASASDAELLFNEWVSDLPAASIAVPA